MKKKDFVLSERVPAISSETLAPLFLRPTYKATSNTLNIITQRMVMWPTDGLANHYHSHQYQNFHILLFKLEILTSIFCFTYFTYNCLWPSNKCDNMYQ